ncbi:MAG TPA: response regulator transcription factor [Gaiellaceae bacterium]
MPGSRNLTPREREILGLLAVGLTNREIAARLHLSVRTVETHRANLQSKLQLRRRSELVAYAIEQRLPIVAPAGVSDDY